MQCTYSLLATEDLNASMSSQDVEAASSRAGTSAYEEALRRGIALVKDRKAASLLDAAKRAGGLSIFDLTEKLAREVTYEL